MVKQPSLGFETSSPAEAAVPQIRAQIAIFEMAISVPQDPVLATVPATAVLDPAVVGFLPVAEVDDLALLFRIRCFHDLVLAFVIAFVKGCGVVLIAARLRGVFLPCLGGCRGRRSVNGWTPDAIGRTQGSLVFLGCFRLLP